jgi:hypothetical protein
MTPAIPEREAERMTEEQEQPRLRKGFLLWDPDEEGLYVVAGFTGTRPKAVLIRDIGRYTKELTLKTNLLPEGWSILSTSFVEVLIGANLTRLRLDR